MLEEYERNGALIHSPVCPRLSDLTIADVSFDPTGGGRVRVTVQNVDNDTALENRTLVLQSNLADGSPAPAEEAVMLTQGLAPDKPHTDTAFTPM